MTLPRYCLLLALSSLVALGGAAAIVGIGFAAVHRGRPWPGVGPFWILAFVSFLIMAATDFTLRIRRRGVIVLKPVAGRAPQSKLVFLGLVGHLVASGVLVIAATAVAPGTAVPGGWWVGPVIPTGAIGALWLVVWSRARMHERRLLRR